MHPLRSRTTVAATAVAAAALAAGITGCTGGTGGATTASTASRSAPAAASVSARDSTSAASPTDPATRSVTTSAAAPNPNATESNPPGDIPDDQVFLAYTPSAGGFSVKVPEGWARSTDGAAVVFTDKLNSIRMETVPAAAVPTVDSVRRSELPTLAAAAPQYRAKDVVPVTRTAGKGVLITYLADSAPNPVTNKVVRNEVERYEFWKGGQEVVLTLSGPKGADNVDPWRIVTDSLTWR